MKSKAKLLILFFTLAPITFGALALYSWLEYQQSIENNATNIRQRTASNAHQIDLVIDDYVEQMRRDAIAAGEQILATLPLPLSSLPILEFRELDAGIAQGQFDWGQAYVVSLDPATRQFYFENREFKSDMVFLVSLGRGVGPNAETRGDTYEFVLAEPLSQPNWVVVARIAPDEFKARVIDALGDDGYVEIDQGGGVVDEVLLLRQGYLGYAPESAPLVSRPSVESWQIKYRPSLTFLQQFDQDSTQRLTNAYIYAGIGALILVIGMLVLLQNLHQSQQAQSRKPQQKTYRPALQSGTQSTQTTGNPETAIQNDNISAELEVDVLEDDLEEPAPFSPLSADQIPPSVFRANDIRGLADSEITTDFARQLARAFAQVAKQEGQKQVCICRDGRLSSEALTNALKLGLIESGCDVIDLGMGPTPLLGHFIATQADQSAGIMVTASHNPKEYNGFKIILGKTSYCGEKLQDLKERMCTSSFEAAKGSLKKVDAAPGYLSAIKKDLSSLRGLHLALDGANGAAGPLARQVFEQLGCTTEQLYCEVDGNFPNHGPDPCQSENLKALCDTVVQTDSHFGIALDGDGDRVVAVDNLGQVISPDQLYQLFARDILLRSPGASLVFDVKASRQVAASVAQWGGKPIMEKSGRTFIQDRVKTSGALLGGEYSSHYFFQDRWNSVDDGIYAACRLAEIVRLYNQPLNIILQDFPKLPATEELSIAVEDEHKAELFNNFRQNADFSGARLIEIDGLRIEYPGAWALVRPSNTGPKLSVRFEASTRQALEDIQTKIRDEFAKTTPDLTLPF